MITRMFGFPLAVALRAWFDEEPVFAPVVCRVLEPPSGSAAAPIASPAPASNPPATRPPFSNVRRSTLLSSPGSMPSIRALILGPAVAVGVGFSAQPALAAQIAPACAPSSLDNSALQDGTVTVSPLPGSRVASPRTQISFLGVPISDLSVVSVYGSATGTHSGRLEA